MIIVTQLYGERKKHPVYFYIEDDWVSSSSERPVEFPWFDIREQSLPSILVSLTSYLLPLTHTHAHEDVSRKVFVWPQW